MNIGKLKRLNYTRKTLKLYMKYMKPGVYVPLENMRTYVLWGKNNPERVIGYQFGNSLKMKLIRLLYITVKCGFSKEEGDIQGTVFYVNNNIPNPKRIKIFDYEKRVVLVKYQDEEIYQMEMDMYSLISECFGLPKILKTNSKDWIVYEELLEPGFYANSDDRIKDKMFNQVILMYCDYFSKCNLGDEKKTCDGYPMVLQHNDLSTLNIIFDKEGRCHIIDWEHIDNNVFFYDVFRWIINDAQQEKNVCLLKNYLEGKYDRQLKKMFSVVNCEYEEQKKVKYLEITYKKMMDIGMEIKNDLEMWKKMRENFDAILSSIR